MAAFAESAPLAGPPGDRCQNCQAPLASDQRYCVSCGERRGRARFSFDALAEAPAPAPAPAAPAPRHRSRVSASINFIAGIATLLLAMGVGVLIGHNSSAGNKVIQAAAQAPQVIKIEGGGTGGSSAGGSRHRRASNIPKAPQAHLSAKVAKAVNSSASKVLGSAAGNLAPAGVQVGQACAHGAGCQGGKFTGNFFGQ